VKYSNKNISNELSDFSIFYLHDDKNEVAATGLTGQAVVGYLNKVLTI